MIKKRITRNAAWIATLGCMLGLRVLAGCSTDPQSHDTSGSAGAGGSMRDGGATDPSATSSTAMGSGGGGGGGSDAGDGGDGGACVPADPSLRTVKEWEALFLAVWD